METAEKVALLNASLERAAEQLGDITQPVMAHYYSKFPESAETIANLWPGRREALEGEMIERVLYCLMTWLECPGEIEIMILGSVPHHAETLKIDPGWYAGLLNAAADVIVATIPPEATGEHAVWQELRDDITQLIELSARYA